MLKSVQTRFAHAWRGVIDRLRRRCVWRQGDADSFHLVILSDKDSGCGSYIDKGLF